MKILLKIVFLLAFLSLSFAQSLQACESNCCVYPVKYTQTKEVQKRYENSYFFSQKDVFAHTSKESKPCKNCGENCHCTLHCNCVSHFSVSIFPSFLKLQLNFFFVKNNTFVYKENKYTSSVNSIWHPPQI